MSQSVRREREASQRRDYGRYMGLDQPAWTDGVAGPRRRRGSDSGGRWLLRALWQAPVLAAVSYVVAQAAGYAPPFLLLLAAAFAVLAVRQAARAVAEPSWRRTGDLVKPSFPGSGGDGAGWYEGGDGVVRAVRRWERRLEWGATSPERFVHTVVGHLGALTDDRLRSRYGITRSDDPVRARRLLGEPAWATLYPAPGTVPTAAALVALVESLSSMAPSQDRGIGDSE